MTTYGSLTLKIVDEIIDLYTVKLLTTSEIAQHLKVSDGTVKYQLKKLGLTRTRSQAAQLQEARKGGKPYTPMNWDAVIAKYVECRLTMSYTELGRLFGVTGPAVEYHVKKLGLKRNSDEISAVHKVCLYRAAQGRAEKIKAREENRIGGVLTSTPEGFDITLQYITTATQCVGAEVTTNGYLRFKLEPLKCKK